jgi:hypothetical protein
MTGDITISWDKENAPKIIEMVKKKMAEGYHFFTIKTIPIIRMKRRVRVTDKNVDDLDTLLIDDAEFERLSSQLDDSDVAAVVSEGHAHLSKRKPNKKSKASKSFDVVKRVTDAQEVLEGQSVALRPIFRWRF